MIIHTLWTRKEYLLKRGIGMLGILLAGIAPGISLLCYFYLKDRYEPEPIFLVIRTFILGAILVFPTAFIEYILETENIVNSSFERAFFSYGLLEELFKWFILLLTIYRSEEFDNPFDGIVYGTSVALGFATAENILYLKANGLEYAFNRAALPVTSHSLFGILMGFYLSKAKFGTGIRWIFMTGSILIPSILHGIYNYILLKEESGIIGIIPFMIFLLWLGLKKMYIAENLSKNYFKKLYNI
jgi:protease PrsW